MSSHNVYMSGTRVRSTAQFVDINGNPANPTTTEFRYRAGVAQVQTNSSPTDDPGEGVFHVDIDTTGWTGPDNLLYTCQWKGTGDVQIIGADYFEVEPPAL